MQEWHDLFSVGCSRSTYRYLKTTQKNSVTSSSFGQTSRDKKKEDAFMRSSIIMKYWYSGTRSRENKKKKSCTDIGNELRLRVCHGASREGLIMMFGSLCLLPITQRLRHAGFIYWVWLTLVFHSNSGCIITEADVSVQHFPILDLWSVYMKLQESRCVHRPLELLSFIYNMFIYKWVMLYIIIYNMFWFLYILSYIVLYICICK